MKAKFCLSLLLCLCSAFAWGQTRQVTGRVVSDSAREALAGVTVAVKGGRTNTTTNAEGRYTINISNSGNTVLVFSYVGHTTQEVKVGDQSVIDVTLANASSTLSDVVVIGYQTIRRKDLTASVSSVSARDLKDIPVNSAAEALNGRLAGVTATTAEGSPDATVTIRVRGGISITQSNEPLYIVDGVQVEKALSVIAPQDIQTIDVLKDAAATAIYGARGANGVIVITTKSGRPGRTVVTYNGFIGMRKLAKELAVMSPYDYVLFQYERTRASSTDSTSFANNFGTTWDTLQNYKNVQAIDWQKLMMGQTGITTTHNLSASGGNKFATFNFGYTFNDEKPIVINSHFTRHILNAKGDFKITKALKVGVGGRYTSQDVIGAGLSSTQEGTTGTSYARLRNAVKYRPFYSDTLTIDEADPLVVNPGNGVALVNPIALANAEYREKTTRAYNVNANLSYQINKNLSFRSTFGYDKNDNIDRQFYDSVTSFSVNQGSGKPIIRLDTVYRKQINNSNVLTYSVKGYKQKHDFDFLVGEETYETTVDARSGQFRDFARFTSAADAFEQKGAASNVWSGFPVNGKSKYTNLSFFGRINYNYRDKYLLSLNGRYDGASKFNEGKKWGFFPGVSFAWRASKEKFMENVDFINDLKFRLGYGKIGNNRIDDYLYLTTYSYGIGYYGLNNQVVNAYTENGIANPDLQWESLVNRNIGVDISFFKSRLNVSVDYYNNTSDKLLLKAKIAPTFGFTDQLQNVGATRNKGFEVQVNGTVIRNKSFNWTANFNIAHNTNTVEELAKGQTDYPGGPSWGISGQPNDYVARVGSPVGAMYGWITDGFYKVSDFDYNNTTGQYTLKPGVAEMKVSGSNSVPGGLRFKDISGPAGKPDGVIDDFDKTIIGNPTPKFTGGLNNQFTYKNWDASIFVNFSVGNDVYNANKIEFTSAYNVTNNFLDIMSSRWKTVDGNGNVIERFQTIGGKVYAFGAPPEDLAKANANATIWMPSGLTSFGSGGGNYSYYLHSWAIEDGSFLRLNNVTIGYTLPTMSLKKVGISKLRFYVTANNLAIITNYSGYDPEVSVRANGLTPGLDYSAYPKSRTFLFGLNATF
jgi:TonB-linked SusC/RagA family outer membrane protein